MSGQGGSAAGKILKAMVLLFLVLLFVSFGRLILNYIDGDTLTIDTVGACSVNSDYGILDNATRAWLHAGCEEPAEEEPAEPEAEPAVEPAPEEEITQE